MDIWAWLALGTSLVQFKQNRKNEKDWADHYDMYHSALAINSAFEKELAAARGEGQEQCEKKDPDGAVEAAGGDASSG